MPLIILLLILSIPVIELSVLIDIGGEIGALPTVGLCLLTAAVGLSIVRQQSISNFRNMQDAHISEKLVHGVFLALAGIFLLIPGFVTDFFGALFLIPPLRLALGRKALGWMQANRAGTVRQTSVVIDGEFRDETEHQTVEIHLESTRQDTDKPKN